ncbi:hypothetical protein F2Q69_00030912 [Brassica cretica]|uniref:Uncharacterized protein n=1 Tax=Brassica cretica TaxID=69181 RepID=A0A8S9RYI5_BRACR|nr:hypothetical protein F2Q69_00030912 [Brassica cretica]
MRIVMIASLIHIDIDGYDACISGAVINGSNVKWDNISVQDECPSPVNQESEITRVR